MKHRKLSVLRLKSHLNIFLNIIWKLKEKHSRFISTLKYTFLFHSQGQFHCSLIVFLSCVREINQWKSALGVTINCDIVLPFQGFIGFFDIFNLFWIDTTPNWSFFEIKRSGQLSKTRDKKVRVTMNSRQLKNYSSNIRVMNWDHWIIWGILLQFS